jgi:RNA polymerase sigma-70 factor (ECF subfamily)
MAFGRNDTVAARWARGWNNLMARPASDATSLTFDRLVDADDATLVREFLAGHRDAFDLIVERHRRHVYQLCYRFVGNHEDAADLSQDVFVRAFKGLHRFKGDSSIGTWLHRIAVNACLNRVSQKRPPLEALTGMDRASEAEVDALTAVTRLETAGAVRRAIGQLPPKQRATVVLRIYQELSHEEIARILGSSVGAAKANFFHALGNLRKLMKS